MFRVAIGLGAVTLLAVGLASRADTPPEGFVSLFNGKDLSGWKVPPGDNGHWKVVGGVIDCDARSESKVPDKSLWSEKSFKDFVLRADWRLKNDEKGFMNPHVKQILPDGSHKKKPDGTYEEIKGSKILYNRKTGEFSLDGGRLINWSRLETGSPLDLCRATFPGASGSFAVARLDADRQDETFLALGLIAGDDR